MRNEEIISEHLNLFSLKPHSGLELNFLFWVQNTVRDFFIFTPSLKIEKRTPYMEMTSFLPSLCILI